MPYFIRECPDDTVMMLNAAGQVVSVHEHVEEAIAACTDARARARMHVCAGPLAAARAA